MEFLRWTEEQLTKFKADPNITEDSIYADSIMRPMAEALCPQILRQHDIEWNTDTALGPNWHTFADDLEQAIKDAHKQNDEATLERYYSFLNWALFEPTSYLSNETFISPFKGIIEVNPDKWMRYIPMQILDELIPFMRIYMASDISAGMEQEKTRLLREDPWLHKACWMKCHKIFTDVAIEKGVPYTNLL